MSSSGHSWPQKCGLCDVTLTSEVAGVSHYSGSKHQQKVKALQNQVDAEKKAKQKKQQQQQQQTQQKQQQRETKPEPKKTHAQERISTTSGNANTTKVNKGSARRRSSSRSSEKSNTRPEATRGSCQRRGQRRGQRPPSSQPGLLGMSPSLGNLIDAQMGHIFGIPPLMGVSPRGRPPRGARGGTRPPYRGRDRQGAKRMENETDAKNYNQPTEKKIDFSVGSAECPDDESDVDDEESDGSEVIDGEEDAEDQSMLRDMIEQILSERKIESKADLKDGDLESIEEMVRSLLA